MINIQIESPFETEVNPQSVEQAINAVLEYNGLPATVELTVVIDGDETLQQLNQQFLGIDRPTDVLSFPSDGEIDPETGSQYLGDIIISYPHAQAQAVELNNSIQDEIQLLAVHGTLHLLGYDHAEVEEKDEMWSAQNLILEQLGCKITRLPE